VVNVGSSTGRPGSLRRVKALEYRGDRLFYSVNDSLLLLFFLLVIYPLIYIVSSSFSSPFATMTGRVWLWPVEPTLRAYREVFENPKVLSGYSNTIFYTVTGTALNVVLTVCAAYPLSRPGFRARGPLMMVFAFTMFFSGGMIPRYILVHKLGLLNTRWAMILPTALSVYNVIITRTFFQHNIPEELVDAAKIDGCSDLRFMVQVAVPLSKAVIAVITLFYAVGHWNAFLNALLYLSKRSLFPLQLVLREILILNQIDYSMLENMQIEEIEAREGMAQVLRYALIVVASFPVLMLYPLIQKYFVRGVMIGSLKG
jgi:multiple sugar transport system permease protein/putative aldouronate transport system permease protein